MGMNSVGSGQNVNVYNSKTASPEMLNAMKQKMQEAEANNFEGIKEIKPNNFEDGSAMSEQSASISKNLKDASQEVKEMLKNPNMLNDCFPNISKEPKGPKNQIEDGGPKQAEQLTDEKIEKLKNLSQSAGGKEGLTNLKQELNRANGTKQELTPEQMEEKLNAMSEAAQNGSTLTPMSPEEAAKMQQVFKKLQ